VHRNIAAFGGDSDKITIMGESSGAGSVDALITAPPNPVPFHAAIMQSGQATIYASGEDSTAAWDGLVKAVNCSSDNTLECIRAVPASMLRENMERLALDFGPVPDGGVTWAGTPRQNRLNSTDDDPLVARVSVLVGSNADEGSIYSVGQNDTEAYLRGSLPGGATDEVIQALLNAYSLGSPGISNEFERISSINTEFVFQCPVKVVAEESVEVNIKAWRYYFNASFPNTQLFEGSGAYHSAEIAAVFGTYPEEGATEFQMDVSKAMQKAWADFAKEPNRGPGWEMVPKIGGFGSSATADVDDNARWEVFAVIDTGDVDGRCGLYQALNDAISYG
jgi:carboxylesterase type B